MAEELMNDTITASYVDLLVDAGISISSMDQVHMAIGSFPARVDWVIHLSVALPYIPTMLSRMIPMIKSMGLYVTMPKDEATAAQILNGELGLEYMGKVITCYTTDGSEAVTLYHTLLPLTEGIAGPKVLTAAPLGGILYTQYVGQAAYHKSLWPYPMSMPVPEKQKKLLLNHRYKILKSIKGDLKGDVFIGMYLKGFLRIGFCIIKEGCQDMKTDIAKRSMAERLQWQMKIQQRMHGIIPVPRVIDLCQHGGNTYLIMERIKGISFVKIITAWHKQGIWQQQPRNRQIKIINWLITIATGIQKFHDQGYVHRDITPNNFILDRKGHIYFIDFEMSYNFQQRFPLPPFSTGTRGFMSPQQARNEEPTLKEDSWAFGGMMVFFFTGKDPQLYRYRDPDTLAEDLETLIGVPELVNMIRTCYQHEPSERPSIQQIINVLQHFK